METSAFHTPQETDVDDVTTTPHSNDVSMNYDDSVLSPSSEKHDYNFSGVYDDSSAQSGPDENTDEEIARLNGTTVSSRSSISSLPASVVVSPFDKPDTPITPAKSINGQDTIRSSAHSLKSSDRNGDRDYGSAFRHPSSVIAMQMRDDDGFSIAQRRRDSQMSGRLSNFSGRSSTTSSPTKRKSRISAQKQSPLKKEYPLVLLHCTLLPPRISVPHASTLSDLLQDVLPEKYWRRWKLLNDKVGDNDEVKARGVLIPHPRDDYNLLEEKLLESLELSQPRIRSGHYLGNVGDEAEPIQSDDDDAEFHGHPCPDCGKKVETDEDRKWEIRVYAANGLMRAGAWSAAWSEMEKIDVEVGVWLPEDVRRDAEAHLAHLMSTTEQDEQTVDEREREVYGSAGKSTQDDIDGLNDEPVEIPGAQQQWPRGSHDMSQSLQPAIQASLGDLTLAYLRRLVDDKRNIGIILLSMLVVWLASIAGTRSVTVPEPVAAVMTPVVVPETVISTVIATTTTALTTTTTATMTATATAIATITETSQSEIAQSGTADVTSATLPAIVENDTELEDLTDIS